jgi:hypothetical protein
MQSLNWHLLGGDSSHPFHYTKYIRFHFPRMPDLIDGRKLENFQMLLGALFDVLALACLYNLHSPSANP